MKNYLLHYDDEPVKALKKIITICSQYCTKNKEVSLMCKRLQIRFPYRLLWSIVACV